MISIKHTMVEYWHLFPTLCTVKQCNERKLNLRQLKQPSEARNSFQRTLQTHTQKISKRMPGAPNLYIIT